MKRPLSAFVVVLMLSSSAWAAPLDSGHLLSLAVNASVQKELAMTTAQAASVAPLLATAIDEATTKVATATLAKTLDKEQLARLKEISYQARGGIALLDSEMVTKLGLSQTQVQKLTGIAKDRELDLKMVLQVTRFRDAESKRKFVLDWRKGAEKTMLAELTAEQKAAFTKAQGKKFDTSSIVK